MDLLKYVEPMKHLPERFSNLAFWRGVRKFKDDVVNALEYIDSWGENIEQTIDNAKSVDFTTVKSVKCTFTSQTLNASLYSVSGNIIVVRGVYGVTLPVLPSDFGCFAYAGITLSCVIDGTSVSSGCYSSAVMYKTSGTTKMNLNTFCTYFGDRPNSLENVSEFTAKDAYMYYFPTK